mgnify:CR=1 FL=1
MSKKEKDYLTKAFDSNWIAPLGPNVDLFEEEMANYIGANSGCALSSGSAALHLALKIVGVARGDFVICPSLTFAASANVIVYESAIPIFIDVDPELWTLNLSLLEDAFQKYNPKALISVDLYGQSCDYNQIVDLCEKYNVALIEDAAEALGSEYQNRKCGSIGQVGVLSFNGNKIITTSGGGMMLSNNEDHVKKARFLATQARENKLYYEHKELGYNYRLSNLLAAVGRAQLKQIDFFVEKRRSIFQKYYDSLSQKEGIKFMKEADYGKSNRWLTTLTINKKVSSFNRDQVIDALNRENIESRPVWKPMHMQPLYKDCQYTRLDNFDVSAELFKNGLCLPSGSSLTESDQNRIIDIILSITE